MADYDYKAGKKRIKDILNNKLEVIEQNNVPSEKDFTFDNGYYSWVTAIFVDIRKSTELFADEDKEKVSKIVRSFTSEVIEILRGDDILREIGIRGDCVYAVYTTPNKVDIFNLYKKTAWINTYLNMLNKMLEEKGYPTISVGIGMSTAKELVVKAGRKDVGINNLVWIGKAVARASNLSSLGNKDEHRTLVYSSSSYDNFIDALIKAYPDKDPKSWFYQHDSEKHGTYYDASIIIVAFNEWIKDGMKD